MAIRLYKGDAFCNCHYSQLEIMKDAGWSQEKPKSADNKPPAPAKKTPATSKSK